MASWEEIQNEVLDLQADRIRDRLEVHDYNVTKTAADLDCYPQVLFRAIARNPYLCELYEQRKLGRGRPKNKK